MPDTRRAPTPVEGVRLTVYRTAFVLLTVGVVNGAIAFRSQTCTCSARHDDTVLWVTGGFLLVGGVELLLRRAPRIGVLGGMTTCLIGLAAQPWWYTGALAPLGWPVLENLLLLAGSVMCALLRPRLALPAALAAGTWLSFATLGPGHVALGIGSALSFSTLMAISTYGVVLLRSLAERRQAAADRALLSAARQMRAEQRAFERERWNGLIHDKVLGALRLVIREPSGVIPAAAEDLVTDATAQMSGEAAERDGDLAQELASYARSLGLTPLVDVVGHLEPGPLRESVQGAAENAIANVARHAGVSLVMLRGRLDEDAGELQVRDHGAGFHRDDVPPGRLGIAQGIERRMSTVGGDATVTSRPGAGTAVTLTWGSGTTEAEEDLDLPGAQQIGALMILLPLFYGAGTGGELHPLPWWYVPVVVLSAGAALVVQAVPRRLWWPRLAAMGVTCAIPLIAVAADVDGAGHGTWWAGTAIAVAVVLSFRHEWWWGMAFMSALTASTLLAYALARRSSGDVLVTYAVVFGIAGGAGFARRQVELHRAAVAADAARMRATTAAVIAAEERRREASARITSLGQAVTTTLQRVRGGAEIDPAFRRECILLEGTLRDSLAASPLLDACLVQAARGARERGATVAIGAEGAHVDQLPLLRRIAVPFLACAADGDEVHVFWNPTPRGDLGFVTFLGPWAERGLEPPAEGLRDGVAVVVDEDDGSLVVDLALPRD